ncbi:hypothetical protein [Lysobacter enzymogenes]|uniref:hypothetical protein n=1 Tax=Lysobacter enzymogenes TaxID=69 RepID=UPI000895D960|nr:hypothetical protein [Lysobacter enzymogenes]SDY23544.1 hypothetical protein SAMN05421681_11476 [Lysobacter enzymogenes]
MPLGRLLNLNQIIAGVRPAPAAPAEPAAPAPVAAAAGLRIRIPGGVIAAPAVHAATPVAAPIAAPAVHEAAPVAVAPVRAATPAIVAGAALRMNPALLRAQPAIIAQLEGRTLRPRLDALRPGLLPNAGGGFVRADSAYPISPNAAPDDRCVFEDAKNPQQRYWLPRLRLRNANGRYEVAVAQAQGQDGLYAVSLALETFPAPEIAEAARTMAMLAIERCAVIAYRAAGTSIEQRLPVAELLDDPRGGWVAMLHLSLAERDNLLRAFMSADTQCRLIVSRGYTVAVPLAPAAAPDAPKRQLLMVKGQMQLMRAPAAEAMLRASAVAIQPPPGAAAAAKIAPPPGIAAARLRPGGGASIIEGDEVWRRRPFDPKPRPFPIPRPQPEPQPEPQPQPAPEPRYDVSRQLQDCSIALQFEPQLHPYIYPAGSSGGQRAPRWAVHSLRYPADTGRAHAYFQDLNDPARIYYLPDAFKLARRSDAPHAPALVFQVDQGADADQVMVDLTCEVRPVTDGERLLAARRALADKVPASADNPAREFELRLLRAASSLQMALLRNGAVRSQTVPATIDWDNGFTVNERFEFKDFQDVFGVLMAAGGASNLLQGSVVVATGVDENVTVPVKLNFADMEGELFRSIETPDPVTGAVTVKLLNAIESALRITRLPVWITRGEGLVEGRIEGLDLSQPVDIGPEQSVDFVVQPATPPAGPLPADAIFNTASVRAVPDGEAILKYTLDDSIDQETVRAVTVMTAPEVLANASGEGGEILSIVIEFRGNRRVVLNAGTVSADIEVPVPLMDILLRKDSEGRYEYRKTVVYKSGQKTPTTPWLADDTGVLFVTAL